MLLPAHVFVVINAIAHHRFVVCVCVCATWVSSSIEGTWLVAIVRAEDITQNNEPLENVSEAGAKPVECHRAYTHTQ